jgi:hypothetical protein
MLDARTGRKSSSDVYHRHPDYVEHAIMDTELSRLIAFRARLPILLDSIGINRFSSRGSCRADSSTADR